MLLVELTYKSGAIKLPVTTQSNTTHIHKQHLERITLLFETICVKSDALCDGLSNILAFMQFGRFQQASSSIPELATA